MCDQYNTCAVPTAIAIANITIRLSSVHSFNFSVHPYKMNLALEECSGGYCILTAEY